MEQKKQSFHVKKKINSNICRYSALSREDISSSPAISASESLSPIHSTEQASQLYSLLTPIHLSLEQH